MRANSDTHQTRRRYTNIASQAARIQTGNSHPSQAHWKADFRIPYHHVGRMMLAQSYRNSESSTIQFDINQTSLQPKPCFQIAHQQRGDMLIAVDEDGNALLCKQSRYKTNGMAQHNTHWKAHENAIFDVIWTSDDRHVVTASGDLSVAGWDVETQQRLFCFRDHQMSVKCVRQVPDSRFLFASCSRDGTIAINDTRCASLGTGLHDTQFRSRIIAHPAKVPFSNRTSRNNRGVSVGKTASQSLPRRSVTCLEFRHCGGESYQLITAGATDSVLRFWDLRTFMSMKAPQPVNMVCCSSQVGQATKETTGMIIGGQQPNNRGITSLSMDSTGSKLLVSILHGNLHLFDCHVPDKLHWLQSFCGHTTTSFYVKAAITQYGDLVACGSADGALYVWDASLHGRVRPISLPYLALKGHHNEVNSVKFTPNGFDDLYSCADDGTIRSWHFDRSEGNSGGFLLKANRQEQGREHSWSNWNSFLSQPEGYAYRVAELNPVDNGLVECTKNRLIAGSRKLTSQHITSSPGIPKRFKKMKLSRGNTAFSSKTRAVPQRSLLYYWK
uniref:Uncharacterized protein AlNc14C338G10764 n=1 Tax=Albugo laibachii Nc14 TaxID=890382 RepID=F0WX04_9STRA|nr:conserved hypothetical protein [Albugo laibachii Nc14]|eukprot:CCA25991.1 conserved hypothetical protein [Albugo laibachii Nc14]